MNTATLLDLSIVILFGLVLIGILLFLRLKKRRSVLYLLFFSLFFIYLYEVLNFTLFQYQSLLLLKQLTPGLILNGQTAGNSLNLVPLLTLRPEDVRTSLLNILLMLPLGFGLPFVTQLRLKSVVLAGALFSLAIELLQLTSGLLAGTTFRIADINDVIFNTLGAALGYVLFLGFLRTFRLQRKPWA